ncbi:MAG: IPTL-CTERM sorting domain-containing protein, partial [Acidobacteriota bacterium]
ADATVTEGAAGDGVVASFTISLDVASTDPVSLTFRTADGTATAGDDYLAQVETLVIPAGDTEITRDVDIVGDDVEEATETFTVTLESPVGATSGDVEAIGTILDDDAPATGPDLIALKWDTVLDADTGLIKDEAAPGDLIEYVLTLENVGTAAQTTIRLEDVIPGFTTLLPDTVAASDGAVTALEPVLVVELDTLAAGDELEVRFQVQVDPEPWTDGDATVSNQGLWLIAGLNMIVTDDPETPAPDDATVTTVRTTPVVEIPTLDTWALALLSLLLASAGLLRSRRTRRAAGRQKS